MKHLIISAFGPDKPGIVSHLSGVITNHGGNVEESRMIRLGADFAMMVLVSVPEDWAESLSVALNGIHELSITTRQTTPGEDTTSHPNCQLQLSGADNEGLVHAVTEKLAELDINIEEMETETENAPVSGTILFTMNAKVSHPQLDTNRLEHDMNILGDKLGVEILVGD